MTRRFLSFFLTVLLMLTTLSLWAGDSIPKAAWKRPLGQPLRNPGGRKPNLTDMIDDGYWQGAPVGGFGAGTLSRTYRGDFARWHIKSGVHKYETVFANQFAMYQRSEGAQPTAQVLSSVHPEGSGLKSWQWDYPVGAGDYYALYPKAWFDYRWEKFPAHVMLEQFSPILPNNYKESSYPVAVYRWHADNPTQHKVTVSVLFSWTNMVGWFRGTQRNLSGHLDHGNLNRFQTQVAGGVTVKGIVYDRLRKMPVSDEFDGQMAIAAVEAPGVEVTYKTSFLSSMPGNEVWDSFSKTGKLTNDNNNWVSSGEDLVAAIAVTFTLNPGEKRVVPMVLAWDFPVVEFGQGRKWYRHYTNFYGTSGQNAWTVAKDGLLNASGWSDAIDNWQAQYVNNEDKPLWYRSMLFNELYTIADGGSFWGHPIAGAPKNMEDTFSFLECFDYPFHGTLDVWFYGSMPLVKFWPDLDKQVMRQFAGTVAQDITEKMRWQWKTETTGQLAFRIRKSKGAVPHDLGVPDEDPFVQVNQFSWQDTSNWKDLNSKYVLLIWRDFVLTGQTDSKFLLDTWSSVQEAMQHLRQYDPDNDGLINNGGFPDQTYDVWVVQGESAYSGGLYLAALRASEEIAKRVKQDKAAQDYHNLFTRAQKSYVNKLWTGEYFRYDTESQYKDDVQADQLAGQWYATATGLGDIVPKNMQASAMKKIFNFNVLKFGNGELGAANGMGADGQIMTTNEQVQEVWAGTTFAAAALMLQNGLREEAYKTAWGVYNVVYDKKGYWFRTPEAWDIEGMYRASMYMRPAGIWAMEMLSPEPRP
jgi:non-lysosomal glucosylceramidase